jgi:hypothetical protein
MKFKLLISAILTSIFLFTSSLAFGSGISGAGGGGAPTNAHYLTNQAEAGLTNEVNLGALSTGMLKGTVAAGISTISSLTASSFVTYGTGTAATITNAAAALDFGTIDPVITITAAGTYLLMCGGTTIANGATFAAAQTMDLYAYRTNNTPGEISNSRVVLKIPIMTTLTTNTGYFMCQPTVYTTINTDDAITIYGVLSANPGAGSVQATGAWIMAIGLY